MKLLVLLTFLAFSAFARASGATNVVFFLDIDGVLNSQSSHTMFPDDASKYGLNSDNVTCFTNLLSLFPDCKVVLHTGWNKRAFDAEWSFRGRQYKSLIPQVTNMLGQAYAGITTHIPALQGGCKAREIMEWIDQHPSTNTLYVVLDDDTGPNSSFTKGAYPLENLSSASALYLPDGHDHGIFPMDGDIMVRTIDKYNGFSQTDLNWVTNWLAF